jgi:hypothetical protein
VLIGVWVPVHDLVYDYGDIVLGLASDGLGLAGFKIFLTLMGV